MRKVSKRNLYNKTKKTEAIPFFYICEIWSKLLQFPKPIYAISEYPPQHPRPRKISLSRYRDNRKYTMDLTDILYLWWCSFIVFCLTHRLIARPKSQKQSKGCMEYFWLTSDAQKCVWHTGDRNSIWDLRVWYRPSPTRTSLCTSITRGTRTWSCALSYRYRWCLSPWCGAMEGGAWHESEDKVEYSRGSTYLLDRGMIEWVHIIYQNNITIVNDSYILHLLLDWFFLVARWSTLMPRWFGCHHSVHHPQQ